MNEYDSLAKVYDIWSTGDPAYFPSHDFYVDICLRLNTDAYIVELGIGTGRIAIDVAKGGRSILGVDVSPAMLELCRKKAKIANVSDRVRLIQDDIKLFKLQKKANLIILPFRSIGHLLTLDEKKSAFTQIFHNLSPGGEFVFDHYVFDESWARANHGVPRLMYGTQKLIDGGIFIWDTYMYDYSTQTMQCFIKVEKTDSWGKVICKAYHPLSFSWILPSQVEKLVNETGFRIQALYGDFEMNPFEENSHDQIWVLKKPK